MKGRMQLNELKLISWCTRTKMDTYAYQQIENLLTQCINWKSVIKQAAYHEILSFVYYNIHKFKKLNISKDIFIILEKSYYATLSKNINLWKEFCYIQEAFHKARVEIIPLKGIILAEILYHNIGLRQMADIDILIKENDLLALNAIETQMLQLGYHMELDNLPENYWRKYHCHIKFYNPRKDITVDMHWAFAPPRPHKIDLTPIWKRSRIRLINQVEVLTLTPEDTLFSLCFHICRDIFNLQHLKLRELCDIHELITQYNSYLDWDYIMEKVTSLRIKGAFLYLYILTKRYLGTLWPADVSTKLCPRTIQKLILDLSTLRLKKLSRFYTISLMLIMLDTMSDRFLLCLQGIFILLQKIKFFILNFKRR